MSDRTDIDDCGGDLLQWWLNFEREAKEREEREIKRARLVPGDEKKEKGNGNAEACN